MTPAARAAAAALLSFTCLGGLAGLAGGCGVKAPPRPPSPQPSPGLEEGARTDRPAPSQNEAERPMLPPAPDAGTADAGLSP